MKKLFVLSLIFILTACSVTQDKKSPNDILLSIKDYSCKMVISYFSNKNKNEYIANQTYSSNGQYSMDFLDKEGFSIEYENSELKISTNNPKNQLLLTNYEELNKNPLFLSYFINTYFNSEDSNNIKETNDSIEIILPNNNQYLYSAKLLFKNNIPYSLTYFDKNGNEKVNIIYSEFTSIA